MAADEGVWLCCVGCFQNSSPQTSLVISLRKVQPDPTLFLILSVFRLCQLKEGWPVALEGAYTWLCSSNSWALFLNTSLRTAKFLGSQIVVISWSFSFFSPLSMSYFLLFESGPWREDWQSPCLWLWRARKPAGHWSCPLGHPSWTDEMSSWCSPPPNF